MSSDTKVYATTVSIDEQVGHLKPGMTAVVEIQVDHLRDITSIPIQAVVQRGQDNWCFVEQGQAVERREIALGRTNDKFVEITSGVNEGDRVVLNPLAIMDEDPVRQASPEGESDNLPDDSSPTELATNLMD